MKRLKVLSLAALVAFAACDEGSEPVIEPTPTGTISGVVTIEGTARSGVTVTLSSGATATTDGSGAYSFAGVNAGAYTVSISGFPTDATFSSTAKAATITTAGQVVTVNFDGTYVRTSAVLGSVTAGGKGLAGVKVTLGSSSVNTDANGQYAFSGLRAGAYTVTISGFDAGQYTFASTSSNVTVGVGESKVVSFSGQLLATASITGTVTIDGTAAAGVTATLSTGATATTNASGQYAFSNLTAGNYTVTISGYASDAQFESVAKPVVITSAGSTVTANFAGSYIKTSVITGTVSVSGVGIGGVTVSNGSTSVNTDANGQYSFSALRAGTYTVTISGWDATQYTFATTSASVTVATGEAKVQNFSGAYVATAAINGALYLDESVSNGTFDSTEDKLAVAGIVIQAEGGAVNNTFTTTTDASGNYAFTGLVAGTYRITIQGVTGAPLNAALPGNVAFRAGAATSQLVTVTVGGTGTAHWPFNITRQSIKQYVMLGVEGISVGAAPVAGASVWLYDTYNNASVGAAAGRIGSATTTSAGLASFNFARSVDVGPSGSVDNIVFARLNTLPASHTLSNAENVIEIKYNAKDSVSMSPDTMDATHDLVVVKVHAREIDFDTLTGWNAIMQADPDTTVTARLSATTDANGDAYFTVNRAALAGLNALNTTWPDTLWVRLGGPASQPATNLHNQTPVAGEGVASGRFLRFIWRGLTAAADTIEIGAEQVKYTQTTVTFRAHREQDDSTGVTPTYTAGDGFANVGLINIGVLKSNGTTIRVAGTAATAGTGLFSTTLGTDTTYHAFAVSTAPTLSLVSDTAYTFTLDGSDDVANIGALNGNAAAFNSTFAYKSNNNTLSGVVLGRDNTTAAAGIKVRVQAAAGNIGTTKDTTVTVAAGGAYTTFSNLLEGPYNVSVSDSTGVWQFITRLTTTTVPVSGAVNNTDARTASRDLQGSGVNVVANFSPHRMDTKVQGVVMNDRDADGNVVDIDEALAGAQLQLYRDGSGAAFTRDTLVATATTDANGKYSFANLIEGRYMVRWVAGTPGTPNLDVLRALSTDSVIVTTTAASVAGNPDNSRTVGTTTPTTLPRWDYANSAGIGVLANPAHFMFLYKNTVIRGTGKTAGGVAVPGMTVSLRRCNVSTNVTSPPTGPEGVDGTLLTADDAACTSFLGTTVNTVTDANGAFEFTNLTEGVYEIRPQPTTVAGFNSSAPGTAYYLLVGNGDIESFAFVIS